MRCECCDKLLTDAEDAAKFVESGNRVGMCSGCRSHLPKDVLYHTPVNLDVADRRAEKENEDSGYIDHDLYLGEDEDE